MKQILDLTIDLMKIQSVSSDLEKLNEIVDFIYRYFNDLKVENCFIEKFLINSKPSILIKNFDWKFADVVLNWHLDVVPLSEENQFDPYTKDWNLYWRWSADMKSWCAIMMFLMKEILIWKFDKKVMLMLTCDEETGWMDWVYHLVNEWYWWKIVLIPDGWSLNDIVIKEKWVLTLKVVAKWETAHSSRPWLWKNAIDELIRYYTDLKKKFEDQTLYDQNHRWTSVNMTVINWWIAWNIIPDEVSATINIRFIEKYSIDRLYSMIKDFSKDYEVEISLGSTWNILLTDPKDKYVIKYQNVINSILYKKYWIKSYLTQEHGASDGRHFASKWMPVIIQKSTWYNIHAKNEYAEIEAIYRLYEVYKEFVFCLEK